ncbi:MAG: helix-turn-helix transcriptional regulator [Candidatus Binataceae bacterium]
MTKKTLGTVIKQARMDHEFTQRELAGLVQVRGSHIAYIEGNKRKPSLSLLRRIADVLGLNRRELLFLAQPDARYLAGDPDEGPPKKAVDSWRRFVSNRALHRRYRITPGELKLLKQVSLLQVVSAPSHFLFILNSIRQAAARQD